MKKKRIWTLILVLLAVFISNLQPLCVQAAAPKLNKTRLDLLLDKSAVLKVKNSTGKIVWSSSNEEVASVKNGKVTGKKQGTATITAKTGSIKLSCKVKVVEKYSLKTVYKYLNQYLNKNYKEWMYVSFDSEATEWNGRYAFPIRYQGGNTANVLVGTAYADPLTGKTVFEPAIGKNQTWKIF